MNQETLTAIAKGLFVTALFILFVYDRRRLVDRLDKAEDKIDHIAEHMEESAKQHKKNTALIRRIIGYFKGE